MNFKLDENITKKLPTLKIGILVLEKSKLGEKKDDSYQFQCDIVDQLRKSVATESVDLALFDSNLVEWKKAFKKLKIDPEGRKPSHIALFERIISGKDIPNINSLVNSTNAISMKYLVPIGAHDLDKFDGNLNIGLVEKDMDFKGKSKEYDPIVVGEEFAYMDDKEIITRHFVWRQSLKTMITNDSSRIFIPIDTLDLESQEVEDIANELIAVLKNFNTAESYSFGILSSENNEISEKDLKPIEISQEMKFKSYPISKDDEIINRILKKAVEDVLPKEQDLENLLRSGRRLKVYQGFDPTSETLHIGHTVMMRKLEDFRKLGHDVIMLIGDFTARIGDPTDKSAARSKLSKKEVKENLRLYKDQAKSIIDIDNPDNPVRIVFNNDWLGGLTFEEISEIAAQFTVQQMLKRDMFQKRLEEDKPIHLHEFLYPLMQGWDSVAMDIDIEIGGNDQLFNMLAGRSLVKSFLGKEKIVIAGKLLTTLDGAKMGKSEGNMIKLSNHPNDIYGNVMAFPDDLILEGFELLTNSSLDEINDVKARLDQNENPIDLKKNLAYTITRELKGKDKAEEAQQYFEEVYQKGSYQADLEKINLSAEAIPLLDLLSDYGELHMSKSQLRRLIDQGAVSIDGKKLTEWDKKIKPKDGTILKVGRQVREIEVH